MSGDSGSKSFEGGLGSGLGLGCGCALAVVIVLFALIIMGGMAQ